MTKLTEILQQKGRLLTTEFLPPKAPKLSDLVDKVLKIASWIDSVSLPELKANENGFPSFRMNPIFTALRLRDLTGIETIFHLTPRDYNKNAIGTATCGCGKRICRMSLLLVVIDTAAKRNIPYPRTCMITVAVQIL